MPDGCAVAHRTISLKQISPHQAHTLIDMAAATRLGSKYLAGGSMHVGLTDTCLVWILDKHIDIDAYHGLLWIVAINGHVFDHGALLHARVYGHVQRQCAAGF